MQTQVLQYPVKIIGEQWHESEERRGEVGDSGVGTVACHQLGVLAHPGVVVAGREVGEGAHAVPNVVVPGLPGHAGHVSQHCRQVKLRMLIPGETLSTKNQEYEPLALPCASLPNISSGRCPAACDPCCRCSPWSCPSRRRIPRQPGGRPGRGQVQWGPSQPRRTSNRAGEKQREAELRNLVSGGRSEYSHPQSPPMKVIFTIAMLVGQDIPRVFPPDTRPQ